MTEAATQVESPRPPDWLFKGFINPMMKLILRSPLHGLMSGGLAILTFTGRKSGKQYTTPVAYHVMGDNTAYVFTRSKWWKNLKNGETATLRIKGQNRQATPEVIHDKEHVWELLSRFLEHYGGNARRVGVMVSSDASREDIRAAASDMLAVKFNLR